ncbi:MAG: type VI secretion system domain-containing protein [bacterium]
MNEIPQAVAALLVPVSSAAPTGDAELSQVSAYVNLHQEISKNAPNYANCITWATEVLKHNSKHVRVAAWLCFAWYRQEKIAGLHNGLLLLVELLERYAGQLHPQDRAQRSQAIQFLNTPRVTALLAREKIEEREVTVAKETFTVLERLSSLCRQQFPENGPILNTFAQLLENFAKTVTFSSPSETESAQKKLAETSTGKTPAANLYASSEAKAGPAKQKAAEEEPEPAIQVPDHVKELLEPISAQAPAGQDLSGHELYLKLQMEIGKVKPNYDHCQSWAEELLQEQSKDLNVITWLCFTWYRKEKIIGLKSGLLLMLKTLQQFGDRLHPADLAQRSRAFNFLNRKQLAKILASEKIDASNAEQVRLLHTVFLKLKEEYRRQFSEDSLRLFKELQETIAEHVKTAAEEELKKEQTRKAEKSRPIAERMQERSAEQEAKSAPDKKPQATSITIGSFSDALPALKKALASSFEEQVEGKKRRKIPEDVNIYGLSRQLLWGKQTGLPPADKEGVTQIDGPTKEKQSYIQNFFRENNWDELIPEIEVRCMDDERFKFWLEAQRFVVQALEGKGGKGRQAAEEIKFHLARLINRLPGLARLRFKDKTTPFAEQETVQWLEEEVKGMLGGKGEERILPPIMGEDYEPINKEYETACAQLPENFEKNAEAMQKASAGDIRRKGRFLRGLNLANFCLNAKQYELAKALLADLLKRIDEYHLTEWEPALCTAVWQSTYLANVKLLQTDDQALQKASLLAQQKELFERISLYDGLRALTLASRQPKEGE